MSSHGHHQSAEPTHLYRTWMSSQCHHQSTEPTHLYRTWMSSQGHHQSAEPTHLYRTWMSSQCLHQSTEPTHLYRTWMSSQGHHQSAEPTHLYGTWMSSQRVTISQQSQHIYIGLGCPVRGLPSVNRANTFIWDLDVQSEGYHQSTEPTHLYGTWMSSQRVTISQQSQHIYIGLGCPVRGLPSVNRANTFIWDLDVQSEGYHQSTEPTHLYGTWMSSQRVTISQQSQHIYMGLGCPVRGLPSVNRANTFIWDLDVQSEGYQQSTEPTHLYGPWMSSQRVTISQQSQHIYMGLGCPVRGLPSVNRANTFIWYLDVQSEGYHQSTEPTHLYGSWMSSQRVTTSQQSQHIYTGLGCPVRATISQQSQHIYMGLGCPVRGLPSVNRANTFIWDLDVQSEGYHQLTEPTHLYGTWMSSQRVTISQQSQHIYMGLGCPVRVLPSQHIYMGLGCPVRGLPSVNSANTFIWDLDVQSEGYHQSTEPTHLYRTWMSSQRVTISQQSQHIYMGLGCPVRGLPSVNRANTFIWDLDVQSECYRANTFIWDLDVQSEGHHQSTEPTHL